MTQASLQLQQLVNHLWHQGDAVLNSALLRQWIRRVEAARGWLLSLAVLLLLWIWNWRLVLSGGTGLTALLLVYLVQQGQWQLPKINWLTSWKSSNRPLTLGLICGTIVCLSTYFTLAIWHESGGSWLAKGLILQGFGVLAILLLLIWQNVNRTVSHQANRDRLFDQWLTDLADVDALKRLIAVRRLTQAIVQNMSASPSDRTHAMLPLSATDLAECFRLMLNRETEPAVCRALLDSLRTLNPQSGRSLQAGPSLPFSVPTPTPELRTESLKTESLKTEK